MFFLLNLFDHILHFSPLMPCFIASHAQRFKDNPRNCSCLMQMHMGSFFFCFVKMHWHETPEVFTAPYRVSLISLGFVR